MAITDKQSLLLLESSSQFPIPQGIRFSYGTAGFRSDASILASVVFRAGILAALRALKTGSTIGLMITASHNPVRDNGVKIADPDGGMLAQQWEPFADSLANAPDSQSLLNLVTQFAEEEMIPLNGMKSAEIFLGRDTRPSGKALLETAKQGISAIIGAVAVDMGILTTPQLHWMVRSKNNRTEPSEDAYYAQLAKSFGCLIDLAPKASGKLVVPKIVVDGANGVGGEKLNKLTKEIRGLDIEVRNNSENGVLNEKVGADYVQKDKVAPCGFSSTDVGIRCASFDGDADRLVYFRVLSPDDNSIDLVDGDKILSLFAIFIKDQIDGLNLENNSEICYSSLPKLGIVQTAYANGASTAYLKRLGLEVVFTSTGVKHLHKKALDYDIGLYFEANGHGTILFSEGFILTLKDVEKQLSTSCSGSERHKAALRLLAVSQLINQAVGDAISGLLLAEAVLRYFGWSIEKWSLLYNDLPSRQLKVEVPDRTGVVTTNAETQVVKPLGLQQLIDTESAKYPSGRCFIRPSGTEDVIRVYAEASTQEAADLLAHSVEEHVIKLLGSS